MKAGFSLLEVVIVLTIIALLGIMLVPFLQSSLARSADPVINLVDTYDLRTRMENLYADYEDVYYKTNLVGMKAAIGAEGAGNVVHNRFVSFNPPSYDEQLATGGDQTVLKVTIKNDLGEKLTALFVEQ